MGGTASDCHRRISIAANSLPRNSFGRYVKARRPAEQGHKVRRKVQSHVTSETVWDHPLFFAA